MAEQNAEKMIGFPGMSISRMTRPNLGMLSLVFLWRSLVAGVNKDFIYSFQSVLFYFLLLSVFYRGLLFNMMAHLCHMIT